MPRYLTVEEASQILGTTDRTIRRMLNDKRLPGSQVMEKGKLVWRVHANKEILQKLEQSFPLEGIDIEYADSNRQDGTIDAETVDEVLETRALDRESIKTLAEELVRPLIETIQSQTTALAEKERIIEEQGRQLRLLPDLQKRAEEDRKTVEDRQFETEALRKQLEAIQEQKREAEEVIAKMMADVEKLKNPWWKRMFSVQEQA